MLLRDPFTKALRDMRRTQLVWTVAIVGLGVMYAAFWPVVNTPEMAQVLQAYPEGMLEAFNFNDLTSPAGYLGSAVYGLLIPLLTAVYAIAGGTRAIAGDEDAGTLDLVLAHPVGRARLALHRFAALALGIVLIAAVLALALIALRGPADFTEVSAGELVAMSTHLALFGVLFAALTYAVGAATGRRSLALGVGAAVAVLGYLANAFFPQVDGLAWTQEISPFHWYLAGSPLANGLQPVGALLMLVTAAILVAVGTWLFTRRDIAV